MKSKIKFLLATIMMLVGVTATHAEDITSNITISVSYTCDDDDTGDVSSFFNAEYTVKEGVVVTFRCNKYFDETVTIYLNGTAVATWSGEDTESEYVWTAKKDAKINWAGYDQYSANIYLTETSTVAVTGITLDPATADMTVGGTLTLTANVLPGDATDKSVTWSSSNEAVATVTNGVVTAVAAGEATITVTTTDGAKTATCAVTVAAPAASTYTVTLKEGTEDATSWTITPAEATTTGVAAGTEVKATYGGTKKVKSVKAKKKAAAAGPTTVTWDFSQLSGFPGIPYENGGVTLSGEAALDFENNMLMCSGECTFTAPEGKKFTSIVITASDWIEFQTPGWSGGTWSDPDGQTTINFIGGAGGISTIVFTLE